MSLGLFCWIDVLELTMSLGIVLLDRCARAHNVTGIVLLDRCARAHNVTGIDLLDRCARAHNVTGIVV